MKSLSIALFLGKELHGKNIEVDNYSTLSDIQANTVVFAKKYEQQYVHSLNSVGSELLAIVTPEYQNRVSCSYIVSQNPRLDYLRVIGEFFFTVVEVGALLGENI